MAKKTKETSGKKRLKAIMKFWWVGMVAVIMAGVVSYKVWGVGQRWGQSWFDSGKDQGQTKEWKERLKVWEKVAKKQPSYEPAYVRMAILSAQLGDGERARSYLEKARVLAPNDHLLAEVEAFVKSRGVFGKNE